MIAFSIMCTSYSSASDAKRNYALVKLTDSKEDIIRRATNVVPSPRQYACQKMEFIAFVHFGMNTFTDEELGIGKESPERFNPTTAVSYELSSEDTSCNVL
jgi:alpha-L-fucosidase